MAIYKAKWKAVSLVVLQIISMFLYSCTQDKGLEGERIPVIEELSQQGISSPGKKITIPTRKLVKEWPQLLGGPNRFLSNLELENENESFESSYIIRLASRGSIISPILISDKIYYLDLKGGIHASNLDGSQIWSADVNKDDSKLNYSFAGGLAFNQGIIYLTSRTGKLLALDAKNGEVLWAYNFNQPFRSFPLVYRKKLYVVTGDDLAVAFSLNGQILWSFPGETQANSVSHSASPSAFDGKVFFPFSSGGLHAVDHGNGSLLWKKFFNSSSISEGSSFITDFGSSPIITNAGVLASSFSGQTILNDLNGNVVWESNIGTSVSPLIVSKDVFLIDKNGYLLRVSLANGKVIWSRKLEKRTKGVKYFDPIMVNGKLLLTKNDRYMGVYSPIDGNLIDSKKLRGEVSASPISYRGKLYIPLLNGRFQVF